MTETDQETFKLPLSRPSQIHNESITVHSFIVSPKSSSAEFSKINTINIISSRDYAYQRM